MDQVAVLGAGITGITTAYALLARGYDVTVYDRNRYPAMETSFANGGQLSASNAEVWTTFSTVLKGLKWMLQSDAPLLMNPRPSWHKYRWMAEFLSNIPNYRRNTIDTVRLACAARPLLLEMADAAGLDFDLERRGILHFYRSAKEMAHAEAVTKIYAEAGLRRERLSGEEVCDREPALQGDFAGGYFTETDMSGDIHAFSTGLAKHLEARGVEMRLGQSIEHLEAGRSGPIVNDRPFDAVVVCAGVASRGMARALGDRVNIYPVKGYSITVDLRDEASRAAAPKVSLLDDQAKIVSSRLGNRFRVAGTAEFNGENRDIRADRVAPLQGWVEELFPEVSTEYVQSWAGLRPMMPSMMPRVGSGRAAGVFYNTGHGHLGWTLSAATAHIVADHVAAVGRRRPSGSMVTHQPGIAAK
ncbi:MAG: D-amino acid dehydrogenase [Pseudomonadota bacterium]